MILKRQAKGFYFTFSVVTIAVAIVAWRINPTFERADTLSYNSSDALTAPTQWKNSLVKLSDKNEHLLTFVNGESHQFSVHETGWIFRHNNSRKELWSFFAAEATNGFTQIIAQDSKSIYFLSKSATLYSFDQDTGSPRWIHNLGENAVSDIFPVGREFIVAIGRGKLTIVAKVDSDSGKLIWKSQPLDILPDAIAFKIYENNLQVSHASGNKVLLRLSDGSLF